jgi:cytoskeletal protein CcmA (bactofilin family)
MWKRDQAAKTTTGQPTAPGPSDPESAPPSPSQATTTPVASPQPVRHTGSSETRMVNIGKSVVIVGDLHGSEDLTIEGQVDGKIELRENVLTIGPNGRIKAQVFAKTVVIFGTVTGNITASEKVEIRDGAAVDGDVVAPKVAIAEGAQFHGTVDMQRGAKRPQASSAPAAGTRPPTVAPMAAAATH